MNSELRDVVASKLILDWSPEQIAGWLKAHYPHNESMRVSHGTIDRSLREHSENPGEMTRGSLLIMGARFDSALQNSIWSSDKPGQTGRAWCLWYLSKMEICTKQAKQLKPLKQLKADKSLVFMRFLRYFVEKSEPYAKGRGEYPTLSATPFVFFHLHALVSIMVSIKCRFPPPNRRKNEGSPTMSKRGHGHGRRRVNMLKK